MAHFKCVPCRARLDRPTFPADPGEDVCPRCGAPLEHVGELGEIVGFQAMEPREARLADAERWLDDGDSFHPEAAAQTVALPTQKESPWLSLVERPKGIRR